MENKSIHEKIFFTRILELRVRKKGSRMWTLRRRIYNKIVDVGIAQAMLLLGDEDAVPFKWGCFGEGTTAAADGDDALESEVDRQSVTFSQITTSFLNDTSQWVVTTAEAPEGGWEITEFALVNATPSGGTIYNRAVFAAESLAETDQLEITCKIQGQREA